MRIDRVDLLGAQPQTPSEHEERNDEASLSVRILDYKTGSGELRAIQATQKPIRQPQLLIYALAFLNQKQIKRLTLGWAMVNHKFLGDSVAIKHSPTSLRTLWLLSQMQRIYGTIVYKHLCVNILPALR